jgi:hypothetical protein
MGDVGDQPQPPSAPPPSDGTLALPDRRRSFNRPSLRPTGSVPLSRVVGDSLHYRPTGSKTQAFPTVNAAT